MIENPDTGSNPTSARPEPVEGPDAAQGASEAELSRSDTSSARAGAGKGKSKGTGWLNVVIDYGPLLVFFLTYKYFAPDGDDAAGEILAVIRGTGAFIVAAIAGLAASKWVLGKVSPMLWLSTVLIVGFGALTIYFQNERFIEWKPTVIYLAFGVLLLGGYVRGKPLLKYLLEAAFEGLTEEGWLKLSRNWGVFFLFLAVLNTVLLYTLSFESWLAAKLWLFMPLSFLFTFTQIPMLLKHGLALDKDADAEVLENPPHE